MTDYILILAYAAFWLGVTIYLNHTTHEPTERKLRGLRFANERSN